MKKDLDKFFDATDISEIGDTYLYEEDVDEEEEMNAKMLDVSRQFSHMALRSYQLCCGICLNSR